MTLIIENVTVFDGEAVLGEGMSIVVEGGAIREVSDKPVTGSDTQRLDGCGRFAMPGLIDAHFHCYGAEANPAAIDRMPPGLRALHARRIMEDTLQRGFTTVRDAAGGDHVLAAGLAKGLINGPRLFYPGLAISQTGGHGDMRDPDHFEGCACAYCGSLSVVVDGPDEMRKMVREQLRRGAHQIKLFVSGGVLSPSDPIWMNQFCNEEIRVAVEEAATRRTYVMAHAHTNEAAIRCVKNGVRSIEHATMLEADGVAAIVEHDAFAVPTLAIIDAIRAVGPSMGLPTAALAKVREVGDLAATSLDRLRQAGAKIGFGTDLLGSVMDRQSREFALRREIMSAEEILRSATSVNASLLGMQGKLGTIAQGAFADLLVVDGNPLEDISVLEHQDRLALIVADGRIRRNALV
ncbi:metal-dependent hydrolase family protein [Sphingosinicella microcystinivorans]|uniref:Imidazolonepropionase-like amidohydrolase n=1 Tax=Sphingosinicella microcystinivorans TaxID=335406 RepID=A0AAD1D6T0_SPHMI|nr:amidohydrolase family protein [Sphingosinicella microcystinivorans]RKS91437.1 imidazolonepropionase-like amidohydrolase [Sphingosinicella microcystinivorans]BBE34413.1 peptidase M38 [Sphingosinicella microcystinivorans]